MAVKGKLNSTSTSTPKTSHNGPHKDCEKPTPREVQVAGRQTHRLCKSFRRSKQLSSPIHILPAQCDWLQCRGTVGAESCDESLRHPLNGASDQSQRWLKCHDVSAPCSTGERSSWLRLLQLVTLIRSLPRISGRELLMPAPQQLPYNKAKRIVNKTATMKC